MKLIEGQIIHRRYRLDKRIAKGGMGEVWKAYDLELGRVVAIKALRSDLMNARSRLARLRAEAHNSANLAHPNIAALFEYYEHDGIGFLIMQGSSANDLTLSIVGMVMIGFFGALFAYGFDFLERWLCPWKRK